MVVYSDIGFIWRIFAAGRNVNEINGMISNKNSAGPMTYHEMFSYLGQGSGSGAEIDRIRIRSPIYTQIWQVNYK